MAPHTGSATPEQIDALLNFLDEHRDLARGRLRVIQAKRLWKELCNSLNSMGGCTKTIQQWQKVWFDIKCHAKEAAADFRTTARVPAFSETNEQSTFSHVQPQSQLSLDLPEVMESTQLSELLMSQPQTPRSSPQPARSRRRLSAAGSDVRSRLFRLEEERAGRETVQNTELAGIRVALEELCGLARQFLEK